MVYKHDIFYKHDAHQTADTTESTLNFAYQMLCPLIEPFQG